MEVEAVMSPTKMSRHTRTSRRWKAKTPGGWDVINAGIIFTSDNHYGIPLLKQCTTTSIPTALIPFPFEPKKGFINCCHFFLDDYRFERVWNRPAVYIEKLKTYDIVLTPDFSVYANWPHAINIWQTYRNRWLGCFWQSNGITVIPTVTWGNAESFEYCFLGIPSDSMLAIATPNIRNKETRAKFIAGLKQMINCLNPSTILVYGKEIPLYKDECPGANFVFFGGYGERFRVNIDS